MGERTRAVNSVHFESTESANQKKKDSGEWPKPPKPPLHVPAPPFRGVPYTPSFPGILRAVREKDPCAHWMDYKTLDGSWSSLNQDHLQWEHNWTVTTAKPTSFNDFSQSDIPDRIQKLDPAIWIPEIHRNCTGVLASSWLPTTPETCDSLLRKQIQAWDEQSYRRWNNMKAFPYSDEFTPWELTDEVMSSTEFYKTYGPSSTIVGPKVKIGTFPTGAHATVFKFTNYSRVVVRDYLFQVFDVWKEEVTEYKRGDTVVSPIASTRMWPTHGGRDNVYPAPAYSYFDESGDHSVGDIWVEQGGPLPPLTVYMPKPGYVESYGSAGAEFKYRVLGNGPLVSDAEEARETYLSNPPSWKGLAAKAGVLLHDELVIAPLQPIKPLFIYPGYRDYGMYPVWEGPSIQDRYAWVQRNYGVPWIDKKSENIMFNYSYPLPDWYYNGHNMSIILSWGDGYPVPVWTYIDTPDFSRHYLDALSSFPYNPYGQKRQEFPGGGGGCIIHIIPPPEWAPPAPLAFNNPYVGAYGWGWKPSFFGNCIRPIVAIEPVGVPPRDGHYKIMKRKFYRYTTTVRDLDHSYSEWRAEVDSLRLYYGGSQVGLLSVNQDDFPKVPNFPDVENPFPKQYSNEWVSFDLLDWQPLSPWDSIKFCDYAKKTQETWDRQALQIFVSQWNAITGWIGRVGTGVVKVTPSKVPHPMPTPTQDYYSMLDREYGAALAFVESSQFSAEWCKVKRAYNYSKYALEHPDVHSEDNPYYTPPDTPSTTTDNGSGMFGYNSVWYLSNVQAQKDYYDKAMKEYNSKIFELEHPGEENHYKGTTVEEMRVIPRNTYAQALWEYNQALEAASESEEKAKQYEVEYASFMERDALPPVDRTELEQKAEKAAKDYDKIALEWMVGRNTLYAMDSARRNFEALEANLPKAPTQKQRVRPRDITPFIVNNVVVTPPPYTQEELKEVQWWSSYDTLKGRMDNAKLVAEVMAKALKYATKILEATAKAHPQEAKELRVTAVARAPSGASSSSSSSSAKEGYITATSMVSFAKEDKDKQESTESGPPELSRYLPPWFPWEVMSLNIPFAFDPNNPSCMYG